MRSRIAALLVATVLVLTAAPLTAHHSFDGEYERDKPISLVGTMTGVEWVNPHCKVMIVVTNQDGTTTTWTGEAKPPHVMIQNGWDRATAESMVRAGETVTIKGYAAKNGNRLFATALTRADRTTTLKLSGEPSPPSATTRAIIEVLKSNR
jgi:hypothetical protein